MPTTQVPILSHSLPSHSMAHSSLLPLALCLLVLFQCSFAQIEQVTSQQLGRRQSQQRQQRFQKSECQLDRLNALEPARRFESEAGFTEIWDENDEQFQCAGAVVIRHTIQRQGLLLPSYTNAPKLVYVDQGRGFHGAAFPGCPETFQSSGSGSRFSEERRQSSQDQHQKVRQVREGDVLALPAGVPDWFYNNGDSPLVLVQFLDTGNAANQLDQDFRKFFLAGNPQQEFQSQRESQFERSRYERGQSQSQRQRGEQGRYHNMFNGFDEQFLAEAFNINTDLARQMKNENDNRGIIVQAERELEILSPQQSEQEEEEFEGRQRSSRRYNGIEETFCTARLRHNVNDPARADIYNPRAGRLTTVNSHKLPVLRFIQLSAQKGHLYQNALTSPNWNINAHSICYFTRGNGRVQIVGDNGQTVFDGEVREGQVLTAPQNFATIKKAGNQGLEWIAFKTNDNAQISQMAGRVSTFRSFPEEVIANAFQISREDARRIKNSREEVSVFSPFESSRSPRY